MGTRYATILVGGDVPDYGDNSPADDGSQTEANRVKYTTIQTDMGNPLDAGLKAMDAKLLTQTNEGPDIESGTVTLTTADHNTVQECSGTFILTLPNPSGNAGFQTTIKNNGIGVITVDVDGGANIDGALSITIPPNQAHKVYVNNAESAYYSVTGKGVGDGFASGVIMLFELTAAPTGWTKKTDAAYDDTAIRVVTGTPSTGGTHDFSTQFATLAESATPGVGDRILALGEMPQHNHGGGAHVHGLNFRTQSGSANLGTGNILAQNVTASTWFATSTTNATNTAIVATSGAIITTQPTSSTTAHGHTVDLRVKYRDVIFAEKD